MRKRSKIPCKYKLFSTLNRTFMTSVLTSISLKYKLVKKLYEQSEKDTHVEILGRERETAKKGRKHNDMHTQIYIYIYIAEYS